MIHPLMANAALHGDQIEIDAFGLYCAVPQRLQIIVFVARDCKFQFGHSQNPSWWFESTILQLLTPVNERPCVDTFETGVLRLAGFQVSGFRKTERGVRHAIQR